jgi:NhaA family Na+:H+ antiporter
VGELASGRQAGLPIAAAAGGMLLPALIYLAFNRSGETTAGRGIPMATDIAFALGIVTLLGRSIPVGLKVFLAAFAIVDDLGAVAVIALFYSGTIHLVPLGVAGLIVAGLASLSLARVRYVTPYLAAGVALWLALHESGVHPTIAGVLVAIWIPSRTRIDAAQFASRARQLVGEFEEAETGDLLVITSKGQQEAIHALERASEQVQAPLLRLEHALQPLVRYLIMPLFAFANAGIRLVGDDQPIIVAPVAAGIVAGLVLGSRSESSCSPGSRCGSASPSCRLEPLGDSFTAPRGSGGIGFTMSLFVAALAFPDSTVRSAKAGILLGSVAAGVVGVIVLRSAARRAAAGDTS